MKLIGRSPGTSPPIILSHTSWMYIVHIITVSCTVYIKLSEIANDIKPTCYTILGIYRTYIKLENSS